MFLKEETKDILIWKHNNNGEYSVKSLSFLHAPQGIANNYNFFIGFWKGLVPPKVEVFFWMAILGKINTRGILVKRGILDSNEANCPLCMLCEETIDHALLHCYKH
jgi:hypothetical protein